MGRYELHPFLVYVGITAVGVGHRHKKTKNMRRSLLFVLGAAIVLSSSTAFAQTEQTTEVSVVEEQPANVVAITVDKPGNLKKNLGKSSEGITALKISGTLNYKDLTFLLTLQSITYLDLTDVSVVGGGVVKWKDESGEKHSTSTLEEGELVIKPLMNLCTLFLPKEFRNIVDAEKISINTLHVCSYDGWNANIGNIKNLYLDFVDLSQCEYKEKYKYTMRYKEYKSNFRTDNRFINPYVDVLYVKDPQMMYYGYSEYYPAVVICKEQDFKALLRYNGNDTNIDLSEYSLLGEYLFADKGIKSVNLGDKITTIPNGCFFGCESLTKIEGGKNVEKVGEVAFWKVPAENVVFHEKLNSLAQTAFAYSGITTVEFLSPYAPSFDSPGYMYKDEIKHNEYYDKNRSIHFIIPKGASEKYDIGIWKNLEVGEKGAASEFEFVLESAGSLKQFITPANASKIKSLTLKGFMEDSEFEVIRQCKNLRYLDMTYLYIAKSGATRKKEEAHKEFVLGLVSGLAGAAAEEAKTKYENGTGGIADALNTMIAKDYIDAAVEAERNNKVVADDNCFIPENAFENLDLLTEIHFPLQLKTIKTSIPNMVNKVVLPPVLETIEGGFSGSKITEFVAPSTLTYIGRAAFMGCKNLKKVDLSASKVSSIGQEAFEGCSELEEFRGSKYLTKLDNMTIPPSKKCIGYFYTKEAPTCVLSRFREYHVPRGCKAGWSSCEPCYDDIDW